ncbi:hypothetical protein JD844_015270 [Phrynosoma platyrhinos]|uniref:Uncharacterized protein n=1 Tax=Phrynosoma platyrhinos TaxID=52577 RepID=A0ABQ7T7F9_PHRPL|nr:hypothetical protein JD844_015270 [Phrynosoma platyrhinos]
MKDLDEALGIFEDKFLQERPFVAGREISVADLVAIVELMQPLAVGRDVFESRPKMAAWRSRVEDAVGKELFQEAHKVLLDAKDLSADQVPAATKEKLKEIMVLELYLDLLSQPCRAVYLFAKKNNIPFEFKDVALFKDSILGSKVPGSSDAEGGSAQPGPPQDKLTLSKKVPFLKDGTFVLSEGMALELYLDLNSQPCRAVYIFAKKNNIPFEFKHVELMQGDSSAGDKSKKAVKRKRIAEESGETAKRRSARVRNTKSKKEEKVDFQELLGRPKLQEWRKRVEMSLGKEVFMEAHGRILNAQELRNITIDPPLKAQMKPVLLKMLK